MAVTTWQPGMRITADRLNSMTPQWYPWTPFWGTTSQTNLSSYGDAEINCIYSDTGRMCHFNFDITFGAGTVFSTASDNWTFGLPVNTANPGDGIGMAAYYVGNTTQATAGVAVSYTSDTMILYIGSGNVNNTAQPAGIVDAQSPFPWASGDRIICIGQYQIAS